MRRMDNERVKHWRSIVRMGDDLWLTMAGAGFLKTADGVRQGMVVCDGNNIGPGMPLVGLVVAPTGVHRG